LKGKRSLGEKAKKDGPGGRGPTAPNEFGGKRKRNRRKGKGLEPSSIQEEKRLAMWGTVKEGKLKGCNRWKMERGG